MGERVPEETVVRCLICKQADTQPGTATLTLRQGASTFVVNDVPAQVCPNCGEEYVELVLCPFRPVRAQKGTVP